jgi:hypothetical protein
MRGKRREGWHRLLRRHNRSHRPLRSSRRAGEVKLISMVHVVATAASGAVPALAVASSSTPIAVAEV